MIFHSCLDFQLDCPFFTSTLNKESAAIIPENCPQGEERNLIYLQSGSMKTIHYNIGVGKMSGIFQPADGNRRASPRKKYD